MMTLPWRRVSEYGRKLLGGIGAAIVIVTLVLLGSLETMELASLSLLFEVRGPRAPQAPIVIVTIDEDSFDELDLPWPFPRALHGQLIELIRAGNPLVIGIDLIFPEPSARGPGDDEALGGAVARAGNVVLGAARTVVSESFYTKVDLNVPLPVIRRGAAGVAPVNLLVDYDGHVRRAPPRLQVGEEAMLGFDAQLHRLATAAGLPGAPLPAAKDILINYRGGPRTYPWVPYHRVVQGEVPPEAFAGKIVLVGPTSPVLHDVFSTPFARGGDMPGVEIHANVLETYLRGNPVREIPPWVSTTVAVIAGLVGAWLVVQLHAFRALLAAVLLWVALTAGAYAGFALWDVWMRGMAGTLALVLGYGATVVENFIREQREKRRLSQFFSPSVLREVVRHREGVSLGSTRRILTVLFSDIRGFTSISERLQPEEVAEMLGEYLTEMTEIVFRHGGTVDKYIGDCVMALYNVPFEDPEHAKNAVRTGLEFQERTLAVSARWEAKLGIKIRNGVGINTGEAVVGTLGSRQRLEYTAIGDTVNLAARLESITKDYGTSIIISEFTWEYVRNDFMTRELGEVTVKGKTRPVKIYAVLPGNIRKYPRASLDAAATVTVLGGGRACAVRTRDISEGGVALLGVPDDLPIGSKVEMRCEGGELPNPVVAEGTIVWRRGDLAGLAFTSLEPDAAPVVVEYVSTHTPGEPRAGT
ncbi:MAG: CHASE2 domain-containing protein [Candidatus Rokubacteria bacterium]|nr:CHASE2 domain-containing protein [Candidatus Rokubacteria bacterium]